jgi:hypothetical protein
MVANPLKQFKYQDPAERAEFLDYLSENPGECLWEHECTNARYRGCNHRICEERQVPSWK